MNRYLSGWARGVAAALALVMGLSFAAPPLAAAGVPETPRKSLAAEAAAKVAASANHSMTLAPTQEAGGAVAGESKPFFKTGKGIAALVLMVGASTWLIVSRTGSDVVHSPGRQ